MDALPSLAETVLVPYLHPGARMEGTRAWADHIRGAQVMCLERTGHIGTMTRPGRFAEIVGAFTASAIEPERGRDTSESLQHERSSVA